VAYPAPQVWAAASAILGGKPTVCGGILTNQASFGVTDVCMQVRSSAYGTISPMHGSDVVVRQLVKVLTIPRAIASL
jgi:hypothetical protein